MVSSNLDLAHCIGLDIALFWKVLSVMKLYSAVIIKLSTEVWKLAT